MRNLTKKADLTLYIAKVEVKVLRYMVDKEETHHKTHIVRAKDEWEARSKVNKHYEGMCSPYDISYRVQDIEITEEIS